MGKMRWFIIPAVLSVSFLLYLLASTIFSGYSPVFANTQSSAPIPLASESDLEDVDTSSCSISEQYPQQVRQWCPLIEMYAKINDLQPELIAAVILQESGGDPTAYSSSGAVGLMQVMPRDGIAAGFECVNGPCFASRPSMQELYNPDFNISYGARMLAGLFQRTGDLHTALQAYGPMDIGSGYAEKVLAIMESH